MVNFNLRCLTLSEFLGCLDDAESRNYEDGKKIDPRLVQEAMLRLMEMEKDLLEVLSIVRGYEDE